MATYYVSALAGGGGDGSIGNPWTWNEMAGTTFSELDIIEVLADGTHSATVSLTLGTTNYCTIRGPSLANRAIVKWDGVAGGAIISIQRLGTLMKWLDVREGANTFIYARNFGVDSVMYECRIDGGTSYATYGISSVKFIRCEFNRGYAWGAAFYYCISTNSANSLTSTGGFRGFDDGSFCVGCIAVGGASHGFITTQCFGCIAYNCVNGFFCTDSNTMSLSGCVAVNNSGYGFNQSGTSKHPVVIDNCYAYNNTSGNLSTTSTGEIIGSPVALTADPFNDAASNDFSLNDVVGGGRVLRTLGNTDYPADYVAKYWPFNQFADADTVTPDEADVRSGTTFGVNAAKTGTLVEASAEFGSALAAATTLTPGLTAATTLTSDLAAAVDIP
jgi:hypothetical protein